MKTPSKKEVLKHFKNAEIVKGRLIGEFNIREVIDTLYFDTDAYVVKNRGWITHIWDIYKGYIEIISYIEPTTKVRNSILLQLADNNSYSEEILKKECPKLFESEIEINNYYWVKHNEFKNALVFIQDKEVERTYGFNHYFEWTEIYRNDFLHTKYKKDIIRKATPQEVETALRNEFEKQIGFKYEQYKFENNTLKGKYHCWVAWTDLFKNGKFLPPHDIITIVEKYGKDKVQEYLNNAK